MTRSRLATRFIILCLLTTGCFSNGLVNGDEIYVASDCAEIKSSDGGVLARPGIGPLKSLGEKKGYFHVEWREGKRTLRGWIHRLHTAPSNLTDAQRQQMVDALSTWSDGAALSQQGDYRGALALEESALNVLSEVFGSEQMYVNTLRQEVAFLYRRTDDPATAERLLRQVLDTRRKVLGTDHPEYASALADLAFVHQDLGDYIRAEPLIRQYVAIAKKAKGEKHVDYGIALSNLGNVYAELGDFRRAYPLCKEALAIIENSKGIENQYYAMALGQFASLLVSMGDPGEAGDYWRKHHEINRKLYGEQHPLYAQSVNNLGTMYAGFRDYEQAEPLFREYLELVKLHTGEGSLDYAIGLFNLAFLLDSLGKLAEAEPLMRQSADIRLKVLGDQHPDYVNTVGRLAIINAKLGRRDEAAAGFSSSRRAVRRHVLQVLPGLSERQQTDYLALHYGTALGDALTLSLAAPANAGVTDHTAEWVLNGKAIAHETRARHGVLARQSDDATTAELARNLRDVEQRLSALALQVPGPNDAEGRRAELDRLTEEQSEFSKRLGQRLGRDLNLPEWIDLASVRARLPSGHVLIEIAQFFVYDLLPDEDHGERYVAWVIPPADEGDVRFVDLGEAAVIDAAVAESRRAIQESAAVLSERGEEQATQAAGAVLGQLAKLILEPLRGHFGECRSLIISPDSNLWLVPWSALPTADGRMLIEDYMLRYVVTGRDLLRERSTEQSSVGLALADPDYGLAAEEVASRSAASISASTDPALSRSAEGLNDVRFTPLPATRSEAEAIAPALRAWTGQAPRVLLGPEAIENAAKQARGPRVLLLSTHGFFLPDWEDPNAEVPFDLITPSQRAAAGNPLENPLLRCGLAFAGANTRGDRTDDTTDDGILTGLEIVGMDLRGTELVVLSACETGLGDVRNGEGVAGLRQAFQLAGAEAVVATLWQIPDRDTAIIMGDFFANLAAGQSKAEALRNAQLKRIADRRERNDAAHPLFWAAFTITGS